MAPASCSASHLDRERFSTVLDLIALRIPAQKCTAFQRRLQGHILQKPKVRPIIADPSPDANTTTRLLLLSEEVKSLEMLELPRELREYVHAEGATAVVHPLTLGYELLSVEQVLRALLPQGMEVPSSFEQVGHIAHVNLRECHMAYKQLIGQVLLDKNSRVRTVVNKVDSISNEFRVFPMEVIAGEESLVTQVKENGATFQLDFGQVYWNSRLEREHRRVVQLLHPSEVVCDMMAGIGPFAVPAALRGCKVYANDLNPKSYEYLCANVRSNHVEARVAMYNQCARAFFRALMQPDSAPPQPEPLHFGPFSHVLMNLPASALEFLDVFVGAFHRSMWTAPLPRVHCYCFSKSDDPVADVIAQAERILGCSIPGAEARIVRDVAPQKLMMCVTFIVPDCIAWHESCSSGSVDSEADCKRQRTEG